MLNYISEIILPMFAGVGVTILVASFLTRRLLNQLLDKEIEKYKSELIAKTEVLKTNLAMFSHEQNVAANRVDSQKSKAIHCVFSALRATLDPMTRIIAGCPIMNGSNKDHIDYYRRESEQAFEGSKKLSIILANNAIYFNQDTFNKIVNFTSKTLQLNSEFLRPLRLAEAENNNEGELLKNIDVQIQSFNSSYKQEVLAEVKDIINIFRMALGFK